MARLLSILAAAAVISGCTTFPSIIGECSDPQNVTPVNITYQQQNNMVKLQVAPNKIDVDRGDLIRFKINGSLGKLVSVSGKVSDPAASWITGNGTAGSFYVCVENDKVPNQTYKYKVEVEGIGYLDPEVRVRR